MPSTSRKFDSPHLRSIREKKIRKRKRVFYKLSILFCVFVVVLLVLLNLPFLRFDKVVVNGTKVLVANEVEEFVGTKIEGRLALILPRDSIVFYQKNEIESHLDVRFSRIENVKFYRNGQTLLLRVKEYEGSYLWCGKDNLDTNQCYFLDSRGHIFDESPYFSGSAYLRFYGPSDIGRDEVLGTDFVDEETFSRLLGIVDKVEYLGFDVSRFTILKEKQVDILVSVGGNDAHIYLLYDEKSDDRLNDLALAMTQEPLLSEKQNNFANLEYLDIRFDNKVYYKFSPTF